ncbi:hypothetical protein EZS27_035863, partial [termite gut metagenome]
DSTRFIQNNNEEETDNRFIHRGRLLHTLFSAIKTKEDIEPAIERLLFDGVIGTKEMEKDIRTTVEKAFSLPHVQEWYSGEWQLFNECNILYKTENRLHTRRPDRVMRKDNKVIVLDFKFGEQKKEQHSMQVKEYITLLAQMGYENISGYLWYVEKESIEAV